MGWDGMGIGKRANGLDVERRGHTNLLREHQGEARLLHLSWGVALDLVLLRNLHNVQRLASTSGSHGAPCRPSSIEKECVQYSLDRRGDP